MSVYKEVQCPDDMFQPKAVGLASLLKGPTPEFAKLRGKR